MNFSLQVTLQNFRNSGRSKWDLSKPVHCILNWCQLHHYQKIYMMRKQENKFDYIFHSQLTYLLLNLTDYLIWNMSQSVVTCHVHLCIVINHSLYHCREHKPTFQIINNWWIKYHTNKTVNEKQHSPLFSCPVITTNLLSQLIFYRAAGKTSCSLNRFGLSYFLSMSLFCNYIFFH